MYFFPSLNKNYLECIPIFHVYLSYEIILSENLFNEREPKEEAVQVARFTDVHEDLNADHEDLSDVHEDKQEKSDLIDVSFIYAF